MLLFLHEVFEFRQSLSRVTERGCALSGVRCVTARRRAVALSQPVLSHFFFAWTARSFAVQHLAENPQQLSSASPMKRPGEGSSCSYLQLVGFQQFGAGDEDRTRNFQLGKLTLYH